MYKKILVPIDGSHTANLGLREAIRLAKGQKARLLLLHVVDDYYALEGSEVGAPVSEMIESLRRGGRRTLDRALRLARGHGVKVQGLMLESFTRSTADLIVRHARRWGAQLIVLGTHGRRGMRRLVLGSDAEQVVRMAPVPVLLVRSKASPRRRHRK
jgi:nucleotide-binding universal stress UspA family protein